MLGIYYALQIALLVFCPTGSKHIKMLLRALTLGMYGTFCMVIAFAVLMVRRSLAMAEENQRLREHLQEEVNDKTEHLQKLLTERGQLIAELGHDRRSQPRQALPSA